MANTQQRSQVAELVERHRRDLADRPDVSQRMRKLSQSSGRNLIGPVPKKPRSIGLTIALGFGAVLAMVVCVASAAMVLAGNLWLQSQLNDPSITVQKYYAALGQKNYGEAYSYFSSNLRTQVSEATFESTWSSYDTVDGIIDTYDTVPGGSKIGSASASITVTVVRRGRETAQIQTLSLVKEGNDWHINAIVIGDYVPVPSPTS